MDHPIAIKNNFIENYLMTSKNSDSIYWEGKFTK